MNWLAARVRLRARSLLEILDMGFLFCAENWKTYGRLALAVLLVPLAACVGAHAAGLDWFGTWVLAIILGTLAEGAFTVAAGQLLFADGAGTRIVLAAWGRRTIPYTAVRILAFAGLLLAGLVLIPLPLMTSRAIFVSEYCLLEAAPPTQCFDRGARLMGANKARAFALACSLVLARLLFVVVADSLGQGLVEQVFQLGRPLGALFDSGGSAFALAGYFLSLPYVTAARFIGYIDSRTRAEGWDIQVRFAALVQRASEKAAA